MYLILLVGMAFGEEKFLAEAMSFYDQAAKILVEEKNKGRINVKAFRPKSCPLTSVGNEEIYKKFKGIEEGLNAACVGSQKTALATLNQSISEMQGLQNSYESSVSGTDTTKT